ncbi:MAG: phage tail assembly chaperone [Sphingobium sp.]|nr:phage tail assembly chaperone [Sphingobium sp.]
MSARFAAGAGRLAGVAAWLLGWRPDEFWRATPDELDTVFRAVRGEAGGEGVDAATMARLKTLFPDE